MFSRMTLCASEAESAARYLGTHPFGIMAVQFQEAGRVVRQNDQET